MVLKKQTTEITELIESYQKKRLIKAQKATFFTLGWTKVKKSASEF
jgi:hypothetical protein